MADLLPIDLNCDMGEGTNEASLAYDESIMPYVTSINVACGSHAGDKQTLFRIVETGVKHKLRIGAHPGFEDREGFGRREIDLTSSEVYKLVSQQVLLAQSAAEAFGGHLNHVKPHGALYNMAARSATLANAIANAVYDADSTLVLYGLSGSELIRSGRKKGLQVYNEVFADRTYQPDGTLTPRNEADALILDDEQALAQVLQIIRKGTVYTTSGGEIAVQADTICLHSDGYHALLFARKIHQALKHFATHAE